MSLSGLVPGLRYCRQRFPAVAANLARRSWWTVEDVLKLPLIPAPSLQLFTLAIQARAFMFVSLGFQSNDRPGALLPAHLDMASRSLVFFSLVSGSILAHHICPVYLFAVPADFCDSIPY